MQLQLSNRREKIKARRSKELSSRMVFKAILLLLHYWNVIQFFGQNLSVEGKYSCLIENNEIICAEVEIREDKFEIEAEIIVEEILRDREFGQEWCEAVGGIWKCGENKNSTKNLPVLMSYKERS